MTDQPTTEVARLSTHVAIPTAGARQIVRLAEAVDHLDADLEAAATQGDRTHAATHDRYAVACHELLEALEAEALRIDGEAEEGRLPPYVVQVADALRDHADSFAYRRGLL